MGQTIAAHYKSQKIITAYIVILAILIVGVFFDGDVTYMRSFTYPPGLYIAYLCWAMMAWIIIWRLPYFIRAILRVPALEYDGQKLTVRGWDTYQIRSEDLPNTLAAYGKGESITLTNTPRSPKTRRQQKRDARLRAIFWLASVCRWQSPSSIQRDFGTAR